MIELGGPSMTNYLTYNFTLDSLKDIEEVNLICSDTACMHTSRVVFNPSILKCSHTSSLISLPNDV